MRKYQRIWEALKVSYSVSLEADTSMHARITKAVRKEKNIDLGWKLLSLEQGKKYVLTEEIEGRLIKFKLTAHTPVLYQL